MTVMDPRQLFMDERLCGSCVFCGSSPNTRDHAPSKVLLDDPLPPELPVVPACGECNSSFSLDEQYLACLVEVARCGTVDPEGLERGKIRRLLSENPSLAERIGRTRSVDQAGNLLWSAETDRMRRIVSKLARGHAAFELYPQTEEPSLIEVAAVPTMTLEQTSEFESPSEGSAALWPEIGTRAFLRDNKNPHEGHVSWRIVQPGRYRYLVVESDGVLVHMVMSEYLACRVRWS